MVGIYKITSPSGKIYIGQSTNIEKRWLKNYGSLNCKGQSKLYNSLYKYGYIHHTFEVIEECAVEQLNKLEEYYKQQVIDKFGWKKALFCQTIDGKGGYLSEETKLKISKANKGNTNRIGAKCSEEQKEKISKANKGRKYSEEAKNKISEANKNKTKHTNESKNKIRQAINKPILQYDLQGNFVKEWPSISEASMFYNIGIHNIIHNCKNRQKTAGNFKWKYK